MIDWPSLTVDLTGTPTLLDLLRTHTGATDDDALSRALNVAGPCIEAYLDRVIAKREVLEEFPQHFGTVILHEPQVDVSANLTVYLNGVVQTGYSAWLDRGKLAHLSRTGTRQDIPMDWRAYDQVDVTYTAGYAVLPADIAQSIIYTATGLYKSEGTGTAPNGASGAVKSMSIQDVGSITYDVAGSAGDVGAVGVVPDVATDMLQRYKRMCA